MLAGEVVNFTTSLVSDQLPWVEKYRPTKLDDLIAHKDITSTINKFIAQDRLPHLLFYGSPGTGKTSTILALAKQMYGSSYKSMILELNASDDRGINVVREQIKNFASTKTIFSSGVKLIILDEADAMTNAAQAALRRIIEKYTKNVRFCLICNYVSKIIPAVQSRCTSFRFCPLKRDEMHNRLVYIAGLENVTLTDEGKEALMRLSCGDMRRVLNVLQACSMANNHVVDEISVYSCTGQPHPKDIARMVDLMLNQPFLVSFDEVRTISKTKGYAVQDLITCIHTYSIQIELPVEQRIFLIDQLSKAEARLANGTDETIQLAGLISIFVTIREQLAA